MDGFVEITCPCCNRYKHVKEEELPKLKRRALPRGDRHEIVCDRCWKVFTRFIKSWLEGA